MFPHCCGLRSRIRPVEHNGSRSPARWRGRAPHGRPAAMSHLPYAAYVKLRMNAPRPDGFSSKQEFETLNTIADALVASLAESALFRSAHVRGATGILFRRVRCERLARRVSEFATMHPGCAFDSGSREDPDWQRYFEFRRPSPADRQRNREPARLLLLATEGDPLTQAREIDHAAGFPTQEARSAFVQRVAERDYRLKQLVDAGSIRRRLSSKNLPCRSCKPANHRWHHVATLRIGEGTRRCL